MGENKLLSCCTTEIETPHSVYNQRDLNTFTLDF